MSRRIWIVHFLFVERVDINAMRTSEWPQCYMVAVKPGISKGALHVLTAVWNSYQKTTSSCPSAYLMTGCHWPVFKFYLFGWFP